MGGGTGRYTKNSRLAASMRNNRLDRITQPYGRERKSYLFPLEKERARREEGQKKNTEVNVQKKKKGGVGSNNDTEIKTPTASTIIKRRGGRENGRKKSGDNKGKKKGERKCEEKTDLISAGSRLSAKEWRRRDEVRRR